MYRVAAIDIGTNSARLLIADANSQGEVQPVQRELVTTRLGEGITAGRLLPGAIDRTVAVLRQFMRTARERKVSLVTACATSAVRDAVNQEDFLAAAQNAGLAVRVLSGPQEARLSYLGVLSGLPVERESSVVMDVGGGSTEFIWCQDGKLNYRSVDVGAVRITEGNYDDAWLAARLDAPLEQVKSTAPRTLVGVGGTVTTLAAIDLKLKVYDPALVHGYTINTSRVEQILAMLQELPLEKRRQLPGLQPQRADIIPAGVRIVCRVLRQLRLHSLKVSETDIMYGLILAAVSKEKKD